MEKRNTNRKDLQVIVSFNFQGHEKVYESHTQNISADGMFITGDPDVLDLMDKGESLVILLEYEKNFFMRVTGYIVRVENEADSPGFAMKFLELDEPQVNIIENLLNSF